MAATDAQDQCRQASHRAGCPRRSDAGHVRFTARDIAGLVLAGDMYGAPYDLLSSARGARPDRVQAITSRWRRAGLAETDRIGPGPGWCWLTLAGMRAAALRFPARSPPLARLAHIRAVLAIRLVLEAGDAFTAGAAWWRSERRIRSAAARPSPGYVPPAPATSPPPAPDPTPSAPHQPATTAHQPHDLPRPWLQVRRHRRHRTPPDLPLLHLLHPRPLRHHRLPRTPPPRRPGRHRSPGRGVPDTGESTTRPTC